MLKINYSFIHLFSYLFIHSANVTEPLYVLESVFGTRHDKMENEDKWESKIVFE